jgi:hypothetical protein
LIGEFDDYLIVRDFMYSYYSNISTSRFWLINTPNGALWAPDHHSFDASYSSPKIKN